VKDPAIRYSDLCILGPRLFVDMLGVVRPVLPLKVSLVESSDIVVNSASKFIEYSLIDFLVCLVVQPFGYWIP